MIEINELSVLFNTDNLYSSDIDDDILSIQTFYEKQWLERGLNIKYIKFLCDRKEDWLEPDIDIELDSYRSFGRNRILNLLKKQIY